MKRFSLSIVVLLFNLHLLSAAPSVLIQTEANPQDIYIGDWIKLRISVTYSPDVSPLPIKLEKMWGDFEVLDSATTQPTTEKDGKKKITHQFFLTTFSTGSFKIPSLALPFGTADGAISEAKSEEITVKVKSLLEEKGDEGNLRPLKGFFNAPSYLWLWILLGTGLVSIIIFLLWHWRKKNRNSFEKTSLPPRPAEEIAMESLRMLENDDLLSQSRFKEFFDRLSIIGREYLDNRYQMAAMEKTSTEVLAECRNQNFPLTTSNLVRDILENSDLVKFAKFVPTVEESIGNLNKLKLLIQLTTPQKPLEEKKEVIPV